MHNPFDQSHRDFTIASTNIYDMKEKTEITYDSLFWKILKFANEKYSKLTQKIFQIG